MKNNDQILNLFENYLAQMQFPEEPELLYKPILYSMSGGGKRIRPTLLMLACEAFGGDVQQALPAAAAVEMFHNFTLLHDDIMDNAEVRRGKPSVYASWGDNVAILSGDAMMIYSYRLLSEVPADKLARIADYFSISLDEMLGTASGQKTTEASWRAMRAKKRVPVIGVIRAGTPIVTDETLLGREFADVDDVEEYFYLEVCGDSMKNCGIVDGTYVLFHKQQYAENGDIVACLVDGDSATVKRFHKQNHRIGDFVMVEILDASSATLIGRPVEN